VTPILEYVRLQVRLDEETSRTLEQAARRDGVSISEFVKRAVQDRIQSRSVRDIARLVADEVEIRLGTRFDELAGGEPEEPPALTIFDRSCIDADIHRPGQRCASCGGSAYATR